jgi:hypothetical protein
MTPTPTVDKKWWKSKTFWTNVTGIIVLLLQAHVGEFVVEPETQASMICVINLALRAVTKERIVW